MYKGYFTINGSEFANTSRAAAYTNDAGLIQLRDCWHTPAGFVAAIGDDPYVSVAADPAPWADAWQPSQTEFWGVHPLDVTGLQDASYRMDPIETTGDGAARNGGRYWSHTIRMRLLLLAGSIAGLETGTAWVKNMLVPQDCGGPTGGPCESMNLGFYLQAPTTGGEESSWNREVRGVQLQGVTVISDRRSSRGAYVREIEVMLLATKPWIFSTATTVYTTSGVTETSGHAEVYCAPPGDAYGTMIIDPSAGIVTPPRPPLIESTMPSTWFRRALVMGPSWDTERILGRVTPQVAIFNGGAVRRWLRIRFYTDLDVLPGLDVGECEYEAELVVPYLPANTTLYIDARDREVYAETSGGDILPGTNLVTGSYGRPPTWPILGCGTPYLIRVESSTTLAGTTVQVRPFIRE